nr:hypothetical protein [Methylogaea oryzae]
MSVSSMAITASKSPRRYNPRKASHHRRIEANAGAALDLGGGLVQRPGLFVGAAARQGVEYVHHGNDAGRQGQLAGRAAFRIALAVPAFVVMQRDLLGQAEEMVVAEDGGADQGVLLHDGEFFRRITPRLVQQVVGDADFAHVVQAAGAPIQLRFLGVDAHCHRDQPGVGVDAVDVAAGIFILELGDLRQHVHGVLVGSLQIDVQPQVFQGAGALVGDHLQQIAIRLRQIVGGLDVDEAGRALLHPQGQHQGVARQRSCRVVAFQRLQAQGPHRRETALVAESVGAGLDGDVAAVDGGDDALDGADEAALVQTAQADDLGQHAFEKIAEGSAGDAVDVRRHFQHAGQAAPVQLDDFQVAVGFDGRAHRGVEPLGGELGFVLVVVDVVMVDDVALRRDAGLAGAYDDAHHGVAQFVADVLHQLEAGVVGFHHHVDQRHRDVAVPCQQRLGRLGRGGLQDFQFAVGEAEVLQVEPRQAAHVRLVVHHQHFPNVVRLEIDDVLTRRCGAAYKLHKWVCGDFSGNVEQL